MSPFEGGENNTPVVTYADGPDGATAVAGPGARPGVPRQRGPGAGLLACGKRTDAEHPGSAWRRARLPHVGPRSSEHPRHPLSPFSPAVLTPTACPPGCAGRDLDANAIAPPCRNNRLEGEEGESAPRYATVESTRRVPGVVAPGREIGRGEETKKHSRSHTYTLKPARPHTYADAWLCVCACLCVCVDNACSEPAFSRRPEEGDDGGVDGAHPPGGSAGDGPDADGAEDGPVEEEAGIRQRLGFSRRDGRVCECVRVHVRASALCLCGEVAASMYHKAIEHAGIRRESEPSSGGFLSAQMPCIPKTPKGAKPKARHS
jgi:hypothetical protein